MANREHVKIIKSGPKEFNSWKSKNKNKTFNLRNANLEHINLKGFNFSDRANLRGANLSESTIKNCKFTNSYLMNINWSYSHFERCTFINCIFVYCQLHNSVFSEVDFSNTNFINCRLTSSTFKELSLGGCGFFDSSLDSITLSNVAINWNDHELIAKILLREAKNDPRKRMIAGLVRISQSWCWNDFLKIRCPQKKWALETLSKYVKDGDNAPNVLREMKVVE